MAVKIYSLKNQGTLKLSESFTVAEFARWDKKSLAAKYCGDEVKIDSELVDKLQSIRDHFSKQVIITSAYRPSGYNAGIGGSRGSYHIYGRAVDFYVKDISARDVAKYAESIGAKGIGLYTVQGFVHIDTREIKYFWQNDGGGNYTVLTHGGTVKKQISSNPCADWTSYIKAVQSAVGAAVDGIAGSRTLNACPTLKRSSLHNVLKAVQNRLNYIGHNCGAADGIFGEKTEQAVRAFQKANGLAADGIIGRNTWKKLLGM